MLLAIPFPGQHAGAGTVQNEGPKEFATGERENLDLGPEGLSLHAWTERPPATWTNLSPPNPPSGRFGAVMDYDSRMGKGVMFGGYDYNWLSYDTYTYDLDTNTWTMQIPQVSPPGRESPAMAFASAGGEFVLFGGLGQRILDDTWTYDLGTNTWKDMQPAVRPEARGNPGMAYDSAHDRIVLFGGTNGLKEFQDTWTYDPAANQWEKMNPSIAPSARWHPGIVYDSAHGELILFGGKTGNVFFNDTWTYNLTTNKWTDKHPSISPSARNSHGMVYNSALGVAIMFGGGGEPHAGLCETWTYNLSANLWTNVTPATSPPGRDECAMAYFSRNNAAVVFGGGAWNDELGDTWKLTLENVTAHAEGTYTCAPHDSGGLAYYGALSWDAHVPVCTTLRFQFRSADTDQNLSKKDFFGPDGTSKSFYQTGGQALNPAQNGTRWFQYRAFLESENATTSPLLRGVTISYNLIQELAILSPAGGESWTGLRNINWKASDPDGDSLRFDLFLENGIGSVLLAQDLPDGTSILQWDTGQVPNGTYRIRIIARDDNRSIPLTGSALSADFTVHHPPPPPPPNLPPHVRLVSPPNNSVVDSTSVRLAWIGTDPENDPLAFWVACSIEPAPDTRLFENVSSAQYLDLSDLSNTTTYYWTVNASDGRNDRTDSPVEVWSFTVELPPVIHPPVNRPPRITSTPPANATEGLEYVYNMTAVDPDNDALTYSLGTRLDGMAIDPVSGRLSWTPSATQAFQTFQIIVSVSDGRGGSDNQTFHLPVRRVPPACRITHPADGDTVSGTINVTGLAVKGALPLQKAEVRIDGGNWIAAEGLEGWRLALDTRSLADGEHSIAARAYDGRYYSDEAAVNVTVANTGPEPPRPADRSLLADWWPWVVLAIALGAAGAIYYRSRNTGQMRR